MKRKPTPARARVLELLEGDPATEWTATEVAAELDVPIGTAGSSLFKNWDEHHLARRKSQGLLRYRALNGFAPATPAPGDAPEPPATPAPAPRGRPRRPRRPRPEPAPAPAREDALTRIAALWSGLAGGSWPPGRAWTPGQVEVALIVADHVRGRAAGGGIAPEPGLWFTGYTGKGDQAPPDTKERS